MARFWKSKFLIALNLNFNGGQFYKGISKFGNFKMWKNQNKIIMAEEMSSRFCKKFAAKMKWALI